VSVYPYKILAPLCEVIARDKIRCQLASAASASAAESSNGGAQSNTMLKVHKPGSQCRFAKMTWKTVANAVGSYEACEWILNFGDRKIPDKIADEILKTCCDTGSLAASSSSLPLDSHTSEKCVDLLLSRHANLPTFCHSHATLTAMLEGKPLSIQVRAERRRQILKESEESETGGVNSGTTVTDVTIDSMKEKTVTKSEAEIFFNESDGPGPKRVKKDVN